MQALHTRALANQKSKLGWGCLQETLTIINWDPEGSIFHENLQQEGEIRISLNKQKVGEFVASRLH